MNLNDWLEEHKDELTPLLQNDQTEALFMAWAAGYQAGANAIAKVLSK
jgi:hypothetical protein